LFPSLCLSATNEIARSHNAGGGACSNSSFRCISSICQGFPVVYTANSTALNSAGFLQPGGQGPTDTQDSDSDGLRDWTERTGEANDPVTPSSTTIVDTDGDHQTDIDESHAGTNPLDPGSLFEVVDFVSAAPDTVIHWSSREGKSYDVLAVTNLIDGVTLTLGSVTAVNGLGPWQVSESGFTNSIALNVENYVIKLKP
jgi:hypothetical protein